MNLTERELFVIATYLGIIVLRTDKDLRKLVPDWVLIIGAIVMTLFYLWILK
jgi:hypothetical protein